MNRAKSTTKRFRPYSARGVSANEPFTECICPKCGTIHKMRIRWIGRGIPRKFCEKCKKAVDWLEVDNYKMYT